jgi:hypothetical protein
MIDELLELVAEMEKVHVSNGWRWRAYRRYLKLPVSVDDAYSFASTMLFFSRDYKRPVCAITNAGTSRWLFLPAAFRGRA